MMLLLGKPASLSNILNSGHLPAKSFVFLPFTLALLSFFLGALVQTIVRFYAWALANLDNANCRRSCLRRYSPALSIDDRFQHVCHTSYMRFK
ncbi:hypothetical protein LMH87_001682 [Akanthomyces muscarius]|uniref:Uncharacterized protein n=1 Tax=Akanthomyces muscarius TaxID=2231603 RepID=A0A9W8Q4S6_AKAMU|nr:hypothetical protein LMH87_001682 [Akanthomyces muscarius]KAJ4147135.1 hypothetical protein LMH87_001682 [Akanthomyces muscarius]